MNDPRPRVTIGVPVYNGGTTIGRALDALLSQSYRNFELLVSDNASSDSTQDELLARAGDGRLRVIRRPATVPITENFSSLVEQARGTYFMWAAADDDWDPSFLATLVGLLEEDPGCALAMTSISLVDPDGVPAGSVVYAGTDRPDALTTRGLYRRITKVDPGASLHFFIYGLFRTEFLRALLRQPFDAVMAGDRVLLSEACLSTRLRSAPDQLYRRTVTQVALADRYPEDPMAQSSIGPKRRRQYTMALLRRAMRSSQVGPATKAIVVLPTWARVARSQARAVRRERSQRSHA